ncbi:MAG: exo-alpha-sialidase [Victivallales bacterium]|nr:exo-alpha-sialidase [Victivallales bacterium]
MNAFHLSCIALACLAQSTCLAHTLYAHDYRLHGAKLVPVESSIVESGPEDMNFCFATRYDDGSIHLNHSKGIHTITEYGCSDISFDNGKTWQHAASGVCGINSFQNRKGEKIQISCWNHKQAASHQLSILRYDDTSHKKELVTKVTVELPFECSFHTHRAVIRLKNGCLLACAYGTRKDEKKNHSFIIASDDDGMTWKFHSILADDPQATTAEGPNEATLCELTDGRITALYRDGGNDHLRQKFSSDGGLTWSEATTLNFFQGAAAPYMTRLSDGTVVAISGRPDVYLLIDFTGTAEHFQSVRLYHGAGSSYATVIETAPSELLVLFDESNFGPTRSPTAFSYIHACRYKLVKIDNSAPEDPRAKGLSTFYSPTDGKLPQERDIAFPYNYRPNSPNQPATYEIITIPERPHPVLHLVNHGDNKVVANSEWALFRAMEPVEGAQKMTVSFEFRLAEDGLDKPQFHVCGNVGSTADSKGFNGYARFARNAIYYLDGKSMKKFDYDIGVFRFHAFTMKMDASSGTWSFHKQGDDTPLFTAKLNPCEGTPSIAFGDGSSDIYGTVDVSYIGWDF